MNIGYFLLSFLFSLNVFAAQLKIGMEGYGTTVFSSAVGPEKFEFKILGIMRNFVGVGQDLVIVEMKGEHFEHSTVVAGMSGSPAYVDGQLIGAISYSFGQFSEHAIAGITPIQSMLDMTSNKTVAQLSSSTSAWGTVKAISLPLVSQGLSPSVAEYFKPILSKSGYEVLTPGAGSFNSGKVIEKKLNPGDPVAAVVIDGDMSLAAIGTVTWTLGDKFLAFGHPFWQTGHSELPVATAEIITTIFSPANGHKMGQPGQVIGALTDDRLPGIAGKLGLTPSVIPVHVSLGKQNWQFRIGRHETMTPIFTSMALANALSTRVDKELGGTYEIEMDVTLSTGEQVQVKRQLSRFGVALENQVGQICMDTLSSIIASKLKNVRIDKLDVKVNYVNEVKSSDLLSIDLGTRARPGATIQARVNYKAWQKKAAQKIWTLRIPKGIPEGHYDVLLADRESSIAFERLSGLLPVAETFEQQLGQLKRLPTDMQACVYLQKFSLGCIDLQNVLHGTVTSSIEIKKR